MIDAFDSEFDAPQQPQSQAARTYDPVPVGVCELEIVKAEHKAVPWKATEKNPSGNCIALRLRASSSYSFVFVDLPDDKLWLLKHVARAVGVDVGLCVPDELTGRRASVEIGHIVTRDGSTRAVVKKWLPGSTSPQHTGQEADEKREPPRQPVKRPRSAPPQTGPDDDIPF